MTQPNGNPTQPAPAGNSRRRFWRTTAIATLIGGVLVGAGAKVLAHGGFGCGAGGCGEGRGGFAAMDPEAAGKRAEFMVKTMLNEVSATDSQQARIVGIVKAAMSDLLPLRERHMAGRKAAAELLTKPAIDRAALDTLRDEQMRLADETTRRMTTALAEAAEVLTAEQRVTLATRMQKMRGGRHWM